MKDRLRAHADISTSRGGKFRVRLGSIDKYETRYREFLERKVPHPPDNILELEDFKQERGYVLAIARQINGSYDRDLFDCTAVMMRRLMEVLIIDAYERAGIRFAIVKDGDYLQLSGLIGKLKSGADFKLSRGMPNVMEKIKALGDTAAHSRTYITKVIDVDDHKSEFRRMISELRHLA